MREDVKTLVVGDVHACFSELQELIDVSGIERGRDRVLLVGDAFDRGPDPESTLSFLENESAWAGTISGNHERKHVLAWDGIIKPALSQAITRVQLGEKRYRDLVALCAALPYYARLPWVDVVHGAFEPGVPLQFQQKRVLAGTIGAVAYLEKKRGVSDWTTAYDGEKDLVFGHRVYSKSEKPFSIRVGERALYGVDCGCVTGGHLAGIVFPERETVHVAARRDHWSAVKNEFSEKAKSLVETRVPWSPVAEKGKSEMENAFTPKTNQLAICVDFDGAIVRNCWPHVGPFLDGAVDALREIKRRGHVLVLFTCREDVSPDETYLSDAVEACRKAGVEFDFVNAYHAFDCFPRGRKPHVDLFVDDRNVGGFPGWATVIREISRMDGSST